MIFSSRGTTGKRAVDCCKRVRDAFEIKLRKTLGDALSLVIDQKSDTGLALVPPGVVVPGILTRPETFPKVVRVTPGTLAPGLVFFLAASWLNSISDRTATIRTLEAVIRAVGVVTQRGVGEDDACEECVRKSLWRQTRKQRPERVPGTTRNPFNQIVRPRGRPPHRPRGKAEIRLG